jgi:uncharacterized protein (TIGR03067 family)
MNVAMGLLACLGLAFAQDEKKDKDAPPAPSKELKELHAKLDGKWVLKRVESSMGKQDLPEGVGSAVFDKEKYTFKMGSMTEKGTMTFRLGKKPREVDVKISEGNDKDKTQFGLYELEGDTFKLCVAMAGEPESSRPKAIGYKEETQETLFIFNRAKKDEKKKDEKKDEPKKDSQS